MYVANSDILILPATADTPGSAAIGIWLHACGPAAGGGLFALDAETVDVAWQTPHPGCNNTPGCTPAQSAAVTLIPGIVFSGGLDGHIRAYASDTGRIGSEPGNVLLAFSVDGG